MRAPLFATSRKNIISVPGFFAKKNSTTPVQNAKAPPPHSHVASHTGVSDPPNHSLMKINEPCENLVAHVTLVETVATSAVTDLTASDFPRNPTPQVDFEHLIQEIDKDIYLFDTRDLQDGLSKEKERELSKDDQPRPTASPNPHATHDQTHPNQSIPLNDISNLDSSNSHIQAQAGKK
nr:hypothetical protein CFP56_35477 [Quercus suber]